MKICFFSRVADRLAIDRVEFYATDVRILREYGAEVIVATKLSQIPWGCDLYFVWWWSFAWFPLLIAKLQGRPCLITGTYDYDTCLNKIPRQCYLDRPWWQRLILWSAAKYASLNIFVSDYEFQRVKSAFSLNNAVMIPQVVDTAVYYPLKLARGNFILNVAWSGAINARRKCLPQVIEAFALVLKDYPTIRLVMAGKPGDYHKNLVNQAKDLGISDSVDFIGVIDEKKKMELMQTCALYLQPTLFEGFGQAIAEAMACGAPVVSSSVGAVTEVVGEAGLMVDPENVHEISNAVLRLIADNDLSEALGIRGRTKIEKNFNYERRKEDIHRVLSNFLASRDNV